MADEPKRLTAYVDGAVYLTEYPFSYAGIKFMARMTVVRLADGSLWIHSPAVIDEPLKTEIDALGTVRFLVGSGNFHWLHLDTAHDLFPDAEVHICPGIERKHPMIKFDWFLGDRPPAAWAGQIDQVLVRGTRFVWEVAFFHRATKTLILTDLVENIGDKTPGVGLLLKFWFKWVFRMWGKARPAPEYQVGWRHRKAARESLDKILAWDFDRVVIAHGDLIDTNAKAVIGQALSRPLAG